MKKFFILLILSALLLASCAPMPTPSLVEEPAATPEFSEPEPTDYLVTPDTLTVGTAMPFIPPFCMEDENGEIYGVERIVMDKLAEELGLELKIEKFDSVKAAEQALYDKSVDIIIATLAPTDERKSKFIMSVPYYYIELGLYVRSEDYENYDSTEAFTDKKIGVPSNQLHQKLYKDLVKPAAAVSFKNIWDALDALNLGEIDAFVWVKHFANSAEFDKEKVIHSKIKLDPKVLPVVAFSNSRELMDEIDKIIAAQLNNSTLDKYVAEYSEPVFRPEQ